MSQLAPQSQACSSAARVPVAVDPGRRSSPTPARPAGALLGRYSDRDGSTREVIVRAGFAGSVLVLDRAAESLEDHRLVAHLPSDEPLSNALIVAHQYLRDPGRRLRCRALTAEDAAIVPFAQPPQELQIAARKHGGTLVDRAGGCHRLERVPRGVGDAELRWCRRDAGQLGPGMILSVRETIGWLERYEPVATLTAAALAGHRDGDQDGELSLARLRAELERVQRSPIVLNRGLRRAVLAAVHGKRTSMSEIAVRCGRVKFDARGNMSGESSWLARRVGIAPEGGRRAPTPWVHTEVLALIARDGLGLSPREVEVD